MTSPHAVLKKLAARDLLSIAEYREIPIAAELRDNPKADIAKVVADEVSSHGLWLVLSSMSSQLLAKISNECKFQYSDYGPTHKPSNNLIAKRLVKEMGETGAKAWLLSHETYLPQILEDLEIKGVSAKDKDKAANAILADADKAGLENCFSSFSADRLKQFAANSKLKVYGGANIMNALMSGKDMAAPEKKKKAKPVAISDSQPEIKKGITAVDLNQWYNQTELSEWCKNHKIPKSGTKKELIKRIIDHLAGKDVTTKKAKAKKVAPKKKATGTKRKAEKPAEEGNNKKQKTAQ